MDWETVEGAESFVVFFCWPFGKEMVGKRSLLSGFRSFLFIINMFF